MHQLHVASRQFVLVVACVIALLALCSSANAVAITVTNPGFDATLNASFTDNIQTYPLGSDVPQGYYARFSGGATNPLTVYFETSATGGTPDTPVGVTASLAGWIPSGDVSHIGVQNPSEVTSGLAHPGDLGELVTVGTTSTYNQTLPGLVVFQSFTTYMLSVELLNKGVVPNPTVFTADLTAGGTPVGGTQILVNPTSSTLGSDVVTFTTGAVAPIGLMGIIFQASNSSGVEQMLMDNVTLQIVTPEPSSMVLCALGATALIATGLRRRGVFSRRFALVATCMVVMLAIGVQAQSASITIANPGFDATLDNGFTDGPTYSAGADVPQGYYVQGVGAGLTVHRQSDDSAVSGATASFLNWSAQADFPGAGVQRPSGGASGIGDPGDVGTLTSYLGFGTGTTIISQTVSSSFAPNLHYILSVDLLDKGTLLTPSFTAELTHGGVPVVGATVSYTLPSPTTLGNATVDFVTGAIAPSGLIGIVFQAQDPSGAISQILLDNVTLQVFTPEPSSMVLCALGAAALVAAGWRRKPAVRS